MKSEPTVYSIDDLARDKRTSWDGIRNFRARNFLRDDMKAGDLVLFYHSQVKPVGVAGVARVCKEAHPDLTAFDRRSEYHDPKSSKDSPTWWMVDVEFVEKFPEVVTLETLKSAAGLDGMMVIQRGARLSVQPVEARHFERVLALAKKKR
jgi:predicted RNA-binding protein with PUA-like domain